MAEKKVVPSRRFERPTCPLGGGRSIQLSYEGSGGIFAWMTGDVLGLAKRARFKSTHPNPPCDRRESLLRGRQGREHTAQTRSPIS